MILTPGMRLGPYEVTTSLGAGGMGEVWKARDSRLGREVALKVLPDNVPHGTERHARFDHEAKVLASLNHPNIATLYGVEHLGEGEQLLHVLVMELVAGEGLEERLARGPMPPAEAMTIAIQVASALEAAHESGIVHRDLKPANVRIRPDGTAKVLDFGLAKAWHEGGRGGDVAGAPTITTRHSLEGAIVGTAAYMAPEQARGRAVDHRADVWGFGCLLFEMVVGRPAFSGETVSDIIASVLREEPRWDLLPDGLPPSLAPLLRRCLAKDPAERYQHLADARRELQKAAAQGCGPVRRRLPWRRLSVSRRLAGGSALAVLLVALAALMALQEQPRPGLPTYRPLTFRSGHVSTARFAQHEQTVIFALADDDRPVTLYSTRDNSIESRRLDLPPADVLGIGANGRMLILLDSHREGSWVPVGTLAEADLAGGAPRRLLERANDGALSPDGEQIAAVHEAGPGQRLEYPLGHTVFETSGWISHVSISPDGRRVAFLHHPFYGDDRGQPMIAGPDGPPRPLGPETSNSLQGLAWAPGGEVWYTEFDFNQGGVLWAVRPGQEPRVLTRSPVSMRLQDVAADGRALVIAGDTRAEIVGRLAGQQEERRYEGWNDDSIGGLATDGTMFAGNQQQTNAGGEYTAFVRAADGSPAVLVGKGQVVGMCHDGRWVILQRMTGDRNLITFVASGAGRAQTVDLGDVVPATSVASLLNCSFDGRLLAFTGRDGGGIRPYVLDLEALRLDGDSLSAAPQAGVVRAVGPEGARGAIISPDGSRVASLAPDGAVTIYPVDGGEARPVPGIQPGEVPLQWTRDGRGLLVWDRVFPARIMSVGVDDGRRQLALRIMPQNPTGVLYGQIILTPGGDHYLYRFRRDLSTLFIVDGLR